MSHFNLKSLTFYGVAIGSVVFLFKVVTAYGETRLNAPPSLGGVYQLDAKNFPGCLQSDTLTLTLQQSGIYLSGSLLTKSLENSSKFTAASEKPSLHGKWQPQQFVLSGSVPYLTNCHPLASPLAASADHQKDHPVVVQIQAAFVAETLQGTIQFSSGTEMANFTAKREASQQKKKPQH